MNNQTAQKQRYTVSVYEAEDATGAFVFAFVPKGIQQERGPGGAPKRVPQFAATVRQETGGLAFDWSGTPDDPGAAREEIEAEITARMKDRSIWIDRVAALVSQVEEWARELGWATRRLEKNLDDPRIGKHRVPALLMQEETCRALLEPMGRSASGAEGVVDLYLMPAYDDIGRLYYDGHQWNLYEMVPGPKQTAQKRDSEAPPFSKDSLEKLLAEMKRNAA